MSGSAVIALCMVAYGIGALSMLAGLGIVALVAGRRFLRGW